MQLLINLQPKETLYIRTVEEVRNGGFSFVLYTGTQDKISYDGPKKYKDRCYKLARILLEEFNK